jgi:dTDP-4-dehydrorhamnose 3,5-epimerase-like enzyme
LNRSTIDGCRIIDLPRVDDPRGKLTFIEQSRHVPFQIQRVFYLYDVPTEGSRGAHAHHDLQQFMICVSGSFDVAIDDGRSKSLVHLNRPWKGLYVPRMIWAAEVNFDPGSVCLVLASELYREADYIRDYAAYVRLNAG